MKKTKSFSKTTKTVFWFLLLIMIAGGVFLVNEFSKPKVNENPLVEVDSDLIENGIHVKTGLIDAEGLKEVLVNCTTCHSSKLITQNRMGVEQWNATIRWMQKTQGLWPLGENQEIIVNYLVENYPALEKGRRPALTTIDWYELNQ